MNHHYGLDTGRRDTIFSDRLIEMFKIIQEFVLSYHFDDSDGMIDYFHTLLSG